MEPSGLRSRKAFILFAFMTIIVKQTKVIQTNFIAIMEHECRFANERNRTLMNIVRRRQISCLFNSVSVFKILSRVLTITYIQGVKLNLRALRRR